MRSWAERLWRQTGLFHWSRTCSWNPPVQPTQYIVQHRSGYTQIITIIKRRTVCTPLSVCVFCCVHAIENQTKQTIHFIIIKRTARQQVYFYEIAERRLTRRWFTTNERRKKNCFCSLRFFAVVVVAVDDINFFIAWFSFCLVFFFKLLLSVLVVDEVGFSSFFLSAMQPLISEVFILITNGARSSVSLLFFPWIYYSAFASHGLNFFWTLLSTTCSVSYDGRRRFQVDTTTMLVLRMSDAGEVVEWHGVVGNCIYCDFNCDIHISVFRFF